MGSAISRSLAAGNYRLLLCGNEPESINKLVTEIKSSNASADVESLPCTVNASWEADIIISAVPYQAEKEIASKIREVANQKIVISIANPLNETYDGLLTASQSSAAEELQELLPHSKIVKAFNTTFAADFQRPIIDGKQADAFIAGNDKESVNMVSELVSAAGFNPVIAGDLPVSRTLENMQLLLIQLGQRYNYNGLAGWKILHN